MPKAKTQPVFVLEASLPALTAALELHGVLKASDLKKLKVPVESQSQVLSRLVEAGFEPMPGGVRIPLRRQLTNLLEARGVVGGPLGKLLKGSTPQEAKDLVQALAREGRLHLVVRGRVEAIASAGTPVATREELRALGQLAATVQKAAKARPAPRTLLREDLRACLMDLFEPPPGPSAPSDLPERLARTARELKAPDLGLCFVPELVLAFLSEQTLPRVHEALFQAVRKGLLELRPESGMNRLSALELALCPAGMQETRLSWARPLEVRP